MELGFESKKWCLNINLNVSISCLKFLSGSTGLSGLEHELYHLLMSLLSFDFPCIHSVLWPYQITSCPGTCHILSPSMPLHVVLPLSRTFLFSPGYFFHLVKTQLRCRLLLNTSPTFPTFHHICHHQCIFPLTRLVMA